MPRINPFPKQEEFFQMTKPRRIVGEIKLYTPNQIAAFLELIKEHS